MADYPIDPTNAAEPADDRKVKYAAEEIRALKAYLQNEIADALANPRMPAGDMIFSFMTGDRTNWVRYSVGPNVAAIGNIGSVAGARANADCLKLFEVLWLVPGTKVYDDSNNEVAKGASAAADFAALRAISWPDMYRRVLAAVASGGTLGETTGAETHKLTIAEMPKHNHGIGGPRFRNGPHDSSYSEIAWEDPTYGMEGNDAPHNNMQPTIFLSLYISLG